MLRHLHFILQVMKILCKIVAIKCMLISPRHLTVSHNIIVYTVERSGLGNYEVGEFLTTAFGKLSYKVSMHKIVSK